MKTYVALVTRDTEHRTKERRRAKRYWAIAVRVDGRLVATQAQTPRQIGVMARHVVATVLGAPVNSFRLEIRHCSMDDWVAFTRPTAIAGTESKTRPAASARPGIHAAG